ncbi:site-specific integrase [Paraburkholderia tropica]|uniref:tyrosine-type recombinase/integrase n=1 Tax=Paraburkholderia tropica TaxID=92647 RepID=UPI003018E51B
MARLEHIHYEFFCATLGDRADIVWLPESKKPIEGLPQIFWEDSRGWDEANQWALERAASGTVKIETVRRTMKHLNVYATFLEACNTDWRHFPVSKKDQVLRKFRKHLIDERDAGRLASSTASGCMSTIIQFYRFASSNHLVEPLVPMWIERLAYISSYDAAGFKRALVRLSTDLAIPNRRSLGKRLEDGLTPLRSEHMGELLSYTAKQETTELHLMLSTGFFTGARVGTIVTLTVSSLQTARQDPLTPRIYLLPVGPGTAIATKFSVSGDIRVPEAILNDLKAYAFSTRRLLREAKAGREDKNVLFLSRFGRPYTVRSVGRLVGQMRLRAVAKGMQFMRHFKFHQSRATFGTWLMELMLNCASTTDAVREVRDAMLHKDEKTTLGYIHFLEATRAKSEAAEAFNEAFTGFRHRDWDQANV